MGGSGLREECRLRFGRRDRDYPDQRRPQLLQLLDSVMSNELIWRPSHQTFVPTPTPPPPFCYIEPPPTTEGSFLLAVFSWMTVWLGPFLPSPSWEGGGSGGGVVHAQASIVEVGMARTSHRWGVLSSRRWDPLQSTPLHFQTSRQGLPITITTPPPPPPHPIPRFLPGQQPSRVTWTPSAGSSLVICPKTMRDTYSMQQPAACSASASYSR